jgi:hypothetical protein
MGKLIVMTINSANDETPEKVHEVALDIRKLFTKEGNVVVSVIASNFQDSNIRRVVQTLEGENFQTRHQEPSSLCGLESLKAEINEFLKDSVYTLVITSYPWRITEKLFHQIFKKTPDRYSGPGGFIYHSLSY